MTIPGLIRTKTSLKLFAITSTQTRLLTLPVLARLAVSQAPATRRLASIAFDLAAINIPHRLLISRVEQAT